MKCDLMRIAVKRNGKTHHFFSARFFSGQGNTCVAGIEGRALVVIVVGVGVHGMGE
jgi:hypothetical protein